MTRKDYILIAEALRVQYLSVEAENVEAAKELVDAAAANGEGHKTVTAALLTKRETEGQKLGVYAAVLEVADSLQRDNARFNREHFLAVVRGDKALDSRPPRGGR